jgi:ribosomal protein S18 acetylase RimI-like enzyme
LSPEPVIRPARPEDLPPLARALEALPLFRRYGTTAAQFEASWLKAMGAGEGLWVAERDGAPAGLCWFLHRGAFGRGAYLRTIGVVEGAHGGGLGAALLQAYERETAAAPGGWFLLVSDFNGGAQRFYVRHGYQEVGRLPGFVIPGVSELLFWKPRQP